MQLNGNWRECQIMKAHIYLQYSNSRLHSSKKWQVLLQIDTRASIRGTSMSTPTTVANAAPEERPNKTTAVAIATSK